jgi:hypothetical protein
VSGAIKPVQVWEIQPGLHYVAASNYGPSYNGQLAALGLVDGVVTHVMGHPREYLLGSDLKGATGLIQMWPHHEGHELRWEVDCWEYVPTAPLPPTPTPARSKPKRRRKSKKRG